MLVIFPVLNKILKFTYEIEWKAAEIRFGTLIKSEAFN